MGVVHRWGDDGDDAAAVVYEPVVISGAPTFGTNRIAIFDSLTDNGGGSYTFSIENSVMVNGAGEGCVWPAPMPTGWVDDGTKLVVFRITVQSSAPDGVGFYLSVGICDLFGDAGNAGSDPLVGGIIRQSASDMLMVQTRTAPITKAGTGGTVIVEGTIAPGGVYSAGGDMGTVSVRSVETNLETSRNGGSAADANTRIIVCAGCNDDADTGPHAMTVTIEAAVLSRPSA